MSSLPSSNDTRPDNYEMNAKLCRLVQQCPFMYDRSHPQYLRKEVCDDAWVRIAKEMGESVFPCRERWRNIRTSFARSINTNKVPSSANRTKPYYLHEELTFLARHITPGVPVRSRKRATSASGEESEHIEVSIGEETFNGFERLCSMGGENTDTKNGYETGNGILGSGGGGIGSRGGGGGGGGSGSGGVGDGEDDRQNSGSNSLNGIDFRREDETSSNRFIRYPPPPLQAAPHNIIKCDNVEAVPHCPPLAKRPCNDGGREAYIATDIENRQNEINSDDGFLQELRIELNRMTHAQKIYLKRRVYETLSEIYPLTVNESDSAVVVNAGRRTSRDQSRNNVASTTTSSCNRITLEALQSFEKLCQNLKRETIDCDESILQQQQQQQQQQEEEEEEETIPCNGNAESPSIVPTSSSTVPQRVVTKIYESLRKRNEFGLRTRFRQTDRNRDLKPTQNGGAIVKDA